MDCTCRRESGYTSPYGISQSELVRCSSPCVLIGVDVIVNEKANWPSLKELTIDCTLLTKDSLNNTICDAHNLLILNLRVGTGSYNLEIKSNSLMTLKVLYCRGDTDLFIETPSVMRITKADKLDNIEIYGLRWMWLQFQIHCLKSVAIGFDLDYPYLSNPSVVEEKLRIVLLSFSTLERLRYMEDATRSVWFFVHLVREIFIISIH